MESILTLMLVFKESVILCKNRKNILFNLVIKVVYQVVQLHQNTPFPPTRLPPPAPLTLGGRSRAVQPLLDCCAKSCPLRNQECWLSFG